jgi:hypothetical protein
MVIKGDQCSMASGHPRGVRIELHLGRLETMHITTKKVALELFSLFGNRVFAVYSSDCYHIEDRVVMIMDRFCMNSLLNIGLV